MAQSKLYGTDLLIEVMRVVNEEATNLGLNYQKTQGRQVWIQCEDDRVETQDALEMDLENKVDGIRISRHTHKSHSIDFTEINGMGKKLFIVYKLRGKGMAQTTLNSTITELFPAVAFYENISQNASFEDFVQGVTYPKKPLGTGGVYKNPTALRAGNKMISEADTSSLFDDKVNAARGIYKWILHQSERRVGGVVKDVVWGYRNNTKPNGVNPNHKGDIFLIYSGGPAEKIEGVSIKAGAVGTKPPQFNSYVRPIYKAFGKLNEYTKLQKESYDAFYTGIPNIPKFNQYGKAKMTNIVGQFEDASGTSYEALYDAQLEWMRDKLIALISKPQNNQLASGWLMNEVVKEQEGVPLVVIQSSGPNLNDVHEVNDEDVIKACLSTQGRIWAEKGSGKQNFVVKLKCNLRTTSLNFSIRTNKTGKGHKLGQYINLAVKFNGVA